MRPETVSALAEVIAGGAGDRKAVVVLATPSPVSNRTAEENLGLGVLASVLRADGHEVHVIDGWLLSLSPEELAVEILRAHPDIVGFSCYRSAIQPTVETLRSMRRLDDHRPLVVAGGYGPTFHAAEFLAGGFDCVIRGEGEHPLRVLTTSWCAGTVDYAAIPGASWIDTTGDVRHNATSQPRYPLDDLPLASRETMALAIQRKSPVHVQTARGCQGSCTFCSIAAFERQGGNARWRGRSIVGIVDELALLAQSGCRFVKIVDDSFLEPPRDATWCRHLADALDERGITMRIRASVRADRVSDDVLTHLARAGFYSFSCGVENFAESALRRMGKGATLQQNLTALDAFKRAGMVVQAGHILFDDRTTMDELRQNARLMKHYAWTVSKGIFSEMYAAPNTFFTRRLAREGRLLHEGLQLGNAQYQIEDNKARAVYLALREWQRAHSRIYDMAIDPLSAPKAIDRDAVDAFLALCLQIRMRDLRVLDVVLQAVDASTTPDAAHAAAAVVTSEMRLDGEWSLHVQRELDTLYRSIGLDYDADVNPFI